MLYETLCQPLIFLGMLYFGVLSGAVFEAKNLVCKTFNNQKFVCLVTDIAIVTFCSIVFVVAKNLLNFGEFRLYLLIAFVLGNIIEHISIGFLVEKIFLFLYNGCVKIYRRIFCTKPKSRLMQKLLK